MKALIKIPVVLLLVVSIGGCLPPMVQPDGKPVEMTFNQKLGAGYTTATAAVETAGSLLSAGVITPDDAEDILRQADTLKNSLDVARSLKRISLEDATTKLEAALKISEAIEEYLLTKVAEETRRKENPQ